MIDDFSNQIILSNTKLGVVLKLMNNSSMEGVFFIVDKQGKLLGSITDGDVRRSLLKESIDNNSIVNHIMEKNPKKIFSRN